MAFIRERHECLTGCQDRSPWSAKTDLQYDFIMVYGVDDEMPRRIREYREKGYVVHLMTGSAWGEYQDYLNGEWDGVNHWDESQMDRSGQPILHGVNVPYLCPSLAFCRYLAQKLRPAVDAGVEAVHLEEPEFWDEGGYSEGFKREYQAYYDEPWRPPHLSCENRYKASALKVYLYRRLVESISRDLKAYAQSKGRTIQFYVPTHSLVNYTQWKILSPEGTLLDIPTVDGCIAQVWTGTARAGNVYEGHYGDRTFETAFLEYGVMQELVRGTGRRMWFLHDPVEDNPEYTWEDFRSHYLETVIASLLHPNVHRFEVSPWPTRVFTGIYPKKSAMGSGIRPGAEMDGAKPIPRSYAELLCALIQTLGDMDQPEYAFAEKAPGIGLFMADSGLYQRTFPDSVPHSEDGVEGLNRALFAMLDEQKAGRCTVEKSEALMAQIAQDAALYNDYVASGPFPHFFGLAMPLVKAGFPVRPVQLENVRRYPDYLREYDALILSYEWMKPQHSEDHRVIAQWVKDGGTLLYVGDGSDPYHSVQNWWNTGLCHYQDPAQHLFEMLGLGLEPEEGVYAVGKGRVAIRSLSPARMTFTAEAAQQWREWVREIVAPDFAWTNHFVLQRGPYCIAAVMKESPCTEPLVLQGRYADLLTPEFSLVKSKVLAPGEKALLLDLDKVKEEVRIIGTTARIHALEENDNGMLIRCKAAADISIRMRLKLPEPMKAVRAVDEDGRPLAVEAQWDGDSMTLLVELPSTNRNTVITLRTLER